MADNLEDEWWLGKDEIKDKEDLLEKSQDKRPLEEEPDVKKKKKKRKKKKLSEIISKTDETPGDTEAFTGWMRQQAEKGLSAMEAEDFIVTDSSFMQHNEKKLSLSKYLTHIIPDWKDIVDKRHPKVTKSCMVLVIAASGIRAADLNREASDFKGKCNSAKLFAKHFKIKEQRELLSKKRIHFAVGTPGRLSALIQEGALQLDYTDYLVLDWNYRDVKLRRMVDMPELNRDLLKLFKDCVIPILSKEETDLKIGLF